MEEIMGIIETRIEEILSCEEKPENDTFDNHSDHADHDDDDDQIPMTTINFHENDIEFESIPKNSHFKRHKWNSRNNSDVKKNCLFSQNKTEYIKEKTEIGNLNNLMYSGHFVSDDVRIKLHSDGGLLTSNAGDFVATVNYSGWKLDLTKRFTDVKREFFQNLIFSKILQDDMSEKRNDDYVRFKKILLDRNRQTERNIGITDEECVEDLVQLSKIIEKYGTYDTINAVLQGVVDNRYISNGLKNAAEQLMNSEKQLNDRNKIFPKFDESIQSSIKDISRELKVIIEEWIEFHKDSLLKNCPTELPGMKSNLRSLPNKLLFYINQRDIRLFSDLAELFNNYFYDWLNGIQIIFFSKLENIENPDSIKDIVPLTRPIFYYLCKSFKELLKEISDETKISIVDLFRCNEGDWGLTEGINLLTDTVLNRCIKQQCRVVFELMERFQPGNCSKKTKFRYDINTIPKSFFNSVVTKVTGWFGRNPNGEIGENISDEQSVWMYIFFESISQLNTENNEMIKPLVDFYVTFVKNTKTDRFEFCRVVTHNTIKFAAKTSPHLSGSMSEINKIILKKQIDYIDRMVEDDRSVSNDFRDLLDAFVEYWKNKEGIIDKITQKFTGDVFKSDMETIRDILFDIVNVSLNEQVDRQVLLKYFRSFHEFLMNLNDVSFDWFVKNSFKDVDYFVNEGIVTVVDNRLTAGPQKSYRVLDPRKFIEILRLKNEVLPSHFVVDVIKSVSGCIHGLLVKKSWGDNTEMDQGTCLNATSELILAVRNSFVYLKEQPDYVSFDSFKIESTDPFVSAVENCDSYNDFHRRINVIKDSFWYIRKQNEIDIVQALDLYTRINGEVNTEILKNCYDKYSNKFNSYINESFTKIHTEKIRFILRDVREKCQIGNFKNWDGTIKRKNIPKILAGLAAIWSIQMSKDIVKGKSLKPHCVQILCVFRLLSVDVDCKGVDKHLVQVLTGQGKSLVLGLLSSLLALTGHKVRVVCYSDYLATRDKNVFGDYYKDLNISDQISYGTFRDLAEEILEPKVNNEKQDLRDLVKNRITDRNENQNGEIKQEDVDNTVLLIDEVDVFFSDDFYGNYYGTVCSIPIPGLDIIQEKIWEIVSSNNYENEIIRNRIKNYIQYEYNQGNKQLEDFFKFLYRNGKYFLLRYNGNELSQQEYTNQTFYEEQLEVMISNAIHVARGTDNFKNKFQIINELIHCKNINQIYYVSTCIVYYNTFYYFKLKIDNFDHKNYKNYGYLLAKCGEISYAKLPENYPLILGVTGTLSTLNDNEKRAINESYNINKLTNMPSFFGYSNVKFHKDLNFTCCASEREWIDKIVSHSKSVIESGRSLLIFFRTDVEIEKFQSKFRENFDRLNIFTENTDDTNKAKYVDESRITRTVTLATRGMGRGVDYKTSIIVEKNGGVHVIQTFFSLDVKEEMQIKGRTARKDNAGSYELIVCKDHLIDDDFLKKDQETLISYDDLNEKRKELSKLKSENLSKRIENSDKYHEVTMQYFKSFFT